MRRFALLLLLAAGACGSEGERTASPPAQDAAAAPPMAPQSTVAGNAAAAKPAMLEVPADKAQLQRLTALGYTVHEEHMHPPGTKECPFDMGGGVVQ
jgi:hypothetical protein